MRTLNQEDLQLIQRAVDGDRAAFGQLIQRHKGRVYAMALAVSGNRDEAQELTQETFVRALQNLPRLRDPAKFPAWLRGITYTVGQDVRRRAARERKHLQAAAQGVGSRAAEQPDAGLAAQESSDQQLGLLAEMVSALPETTRMALDLRYREGLSYAEIAEAMNVPVATVRGLLYRGTKTLRQKLKPMLKKGLSA